MAIYYQVLPPPPKIGHIFQEKLDSLTKISWVNLASILDLAAILNLGEILIKAYLGSSCEKMNKIWLFGLQVEPYN